MKLPERFEQRMRERLQGEYPAFLASYQGAPYRGLRVNSLKISSAEFAARAPFPLKERVAREPNAFYIEAEKPGADPYHFAGLYYLQEPSAMCAAPLLEVKKGERVLDLCAAPGGKATQLAADMGGTGVLVANEIDYDRMRILEENLVRMGVRNAIVTWRPPEKLAEVFPAYFDKILVDAPCSGEGMFKKEPNAVPEWSEENVARCAARQRGILDEAAGMLAGGGTLVYSTCTFAEEEDEWQVEAFLARHPEFTLRTMKKLYPHTAKGEGHFAAVLQKEDGPRSARPVLRKFTPGGGKGGYHVDSPGAGKAWKAFSEDFFARPLEGTLRNEGTRLSLAGEDLPLADFRNAVGFRVGLEVGEWDRKLFRPAHALAMAVKREDVRRFVSLSREESDRYLRGETVESDLPDGWCVVGVEEFPLGLGKIVGGVVKNHLPKHLRKFGP